MKKHKLEATVLKFPKYIDTDMHAVYSCTFCTHVVNSN